MTGEILPSSDVIVFFSGDDLALMAGFFVEAGAVGCQRLFRHLRLHMHVHGDILEQHAVDGVVGEHLHREIACHRARNLANRRVAGFL